MAPFKEEATLPAGPAALPSSWAAGWTDLSPPPRYSLQGNLNPGRSRRFWLLAVESRGFCHTEPGRQAGREA